MSSEEIFWCELGEDQPQIEMFWGETYWSKRPFDMASCRKVVDNGAFVFSLNEFVKEDANLVLILSGLIRLHSLHDCNILSFLSMEGGSIMRIRVCDAKAFF